MTEEKAPIDPNATQNSEQLSEAELEQVAGGNAEEKSKSPLVPAV